MEAHGARATFVVVADEIEARNSYIIIMVYKTGTEVVNDVIAEVGRAAADTRIAVFVVGEEVVMNGYPVAAAPG
ncbi:MAG: hypothetical protein ACYSWZ_08795 [Planctomycetota bacterium]